MNKVFGINYIATVKNITISNDMQQQSTNTLTTIVKGMQLNKCQLLHLDQPNYNLTISSPTMDSHILSIQKIMSDLYTLLISINNVINGWREGMVGFIVHPGVQDGCYNKGGHILLHPYKWVYF